MCRHLACYVNVFSLTRGSGLPGMGGCHACLFDRSRWVTGLVARSRCVSRRCSPVAPRGGIPRRSSDDGGALDEGGPVTTEAGALPGVDSGAPDAAPPPPCGRLTTPCQDGEKCAGAPDCSSSFCFNGLCKATSPADGVKNGDETDVDCGGSKAPACADAKGCVVKSDCASGVCTAKVCQVPTLEGRRAERRRDGHRLRRLHHGRAEVSRRPWAASRTPTATTSSATPSRRSASLLRTRMGSRTSTRRAPTAAAPPPASRAALRPGLRSDERLRERQVQPGHARLRSAVVDRRLQERHRDGRRLRRRRADQRGPVRSRKGLPPHGLTASRPRATTPRSASRVRRATCTSAATRVARARWVRSALHTSRAARACPFPPSRRSRSASTRSPRAAFASSSSRRAGTCAAGSTTIAPRPRRSPTACSTTCPRRTSCRSARIRRVSRTPSNNWVCKNYPRATSASTRISAARRSSPIAPAGRVVRAAGSTKRRSGNNGHTTYWFDAATQSSEWGAGAKVAGQSELDVKSINCVTQVILAAFCAWDGGRLPTQAELGSVNGAWGPGGMPWGGNSTSFRDTVAGNEAGRIVYPFNQDGTCPGNSCSCSRR